MSARSCHEANIPRHTMTSIWEKEELTPASMGNSSARTIVWAFLTICGVGMVVGRAVLKGAESLKELK